MSQMELADERHNTDKGALDCWCMPTYRKVCDVCEGEGRLYHDFPCWKCIAGVITISREEAETIGMGLIIVHKEEEE